MKFRFSLACCLWFLTGSVFAQADLLQSGPMVGYSTMKEVLLWVQTKGPAEVHFVYYEQEQEDPKFQTEKVQTQAPQAFTAKAIAKVEPGKKYQYALYINNVKVERPYPLEFQSQTLWQWRTDPPSFRFALGSCAYVNEAEYDRPGNPYGGEYEIFEAIHEVQPDFMLWTGDNTYLREADWNSKTGILHRYTHTRSLPEMQALLASAHHYAIWDDHDFGPNNSDRSYWLKDFTLATFQQFWGNPNYGVGGGISGTFEWADCQFFLLDNRYFRTPNNGILDQKHLLGEEQLQWLIEALINSQAPFKFVVIGGQVLNPVIETWSENYLKYPSERTQLFQAIRQNKIPGVIFLSGDRHHTELSKQERSGTYPLYELTVSPLTAGPVGDRGLEEANTYRVADTYYGQRNFGLLEVSGPRTDRQLRITIHNKDGQEVWTKEIKASELK